MVTGDAAYIKKINRSLIIREIVKEGMVSRANLSKVTNLTRATISAQVADLLEDGLIIETQLEHFSVGRKPIMLSLNSQAGYALGIDLDYPKIAFVISDLLGQPVSSTVINIDTTDYSEILHLIIKQIKFFIANFNDCRYGIVGIVIGVHGLVTKNEVIHYVPRLQWKEINIKGDLEKEVDIDIYIENNANLCSFAERVYMHHETNNLLCVTLHSGIGLGMMMNNAFFQGHDGYAGEAGHMIIIPEGKPCTCGNKGCWEKYASESSFFDDLSEKRNIKNLTYEDIEHWLKEGDEEVNERIKQFIYFLSIGLNNLINMYNPDVLVIDSELLRIYPDTLNTIQENLTSSISHYNNLLLSSFGKKSAVLGACALAIKHFLDVPMLNLSGEGFSHS